MKMASEEASVLLRRFYHLQEERVQTYALFEEGHSTYLSGAPNYNFPMYRQLVHEITQTFKKISDEIIEIEAKMRVQQNLPNVSKFIAKVQEGEKKKLEITAKLQIARQNEVDYPDDASYKKDVQDLRTNMRDVVERINEHMEELKYEAEELSHL